MATAKTVQLKNIPVGTQFSFTRGKLKGVTAVLYKQHSEMTEFVLYGNDGEVEFPDRYWYKNQDMTGCENTKRVISTGKDNFVFAENLKVGDEIVVGGIAKTISKKKVNSEAMTCTLKFDDGVEAHFDCHHVFEQPNPPDFEFTVLVGNSRTQRAGTYEFSFSDIESMTDEEKIEFVDMIFHNAREKLLDMEN